VLRDHRARRNDRPSPMRTSFRIVAPCRSAPRPPPRIRAPSRCARSSPLAHNHRVLFAHPVQHRAVLHIALRATRIAFTSRAARRSSIRLRSRPVPRRRSPARRGPRNTSRAPPASFLIRTNHCRIISRASVLFHAPNSLHAHRQLLPAARNR